MPMYPEIMLIPMREELTRAGASKSLRTPDAVEAALANQPGTSMVIVNSVCGCAAGIDASRRSAGSAARREPEQNLQRLRRPGPRSHRQSARILHRDTFRRHHRLAFCATASSLYMMERRQIEGRDAATIAADLTGAFDRLCARVATQ